MEAGSLLAGGGVSGGIVAALFIASKCCYRRKFHSKCCGAEMDVDGGAPSPTEQPVQLEMPRMATPKPSPVITGGPRAFLVPPRDPSSPQVTAVALDLDLFGNVGILRLQAK